MKTPVKTTRYGPGTYRPAPNRRGYDAYISLGGKRHRRRLPTEPEARAWIDAAAADGPLSQPPLSRAQIIDARAALALLPPGVSLADAARAAASAARERLEFRATLGEAVAAFFAAQTAKPISLACYRAHLSALARSLPPGATAASVTAAHLSALIGGRAGATRRNWKTTFSVFFRWCARNGLAPGNPAAEIPVGRVPEPPRGVLTPAQAAGLLHAAERHDRALIPYLAIGLFAGIRPAEMSRLTPDRIGPAYITIEGRVAKTSAHRTVTVRPNLAAWLAAYPPAPGRPVSSACRMTVSKRLAALRRAVLAEADPSAHIASWPADGMRHSFASYAYEQCRDAAAVAYEMGHTGTAIFFRHYRALAHPGDGERFFSILPSVGKTLEESGPKRT